jgi:hypothetical protein
LIFYGLDDLNRRVIVTGGNKRALGRSDHPGRPPGQSVYWLYGRGEY